MPLENRNLEPGTTLVARYKKQERTCEVVQTDDATPGSAQSGVRFRRRGGVASGRNPLPGAWRPVPLLPSRQVAGI